MRKHRRPATFLGLMLVLALGAVSGSYALWFQVLTFNGTVNTGELKVEWTTYFCQDNELKLPGEFDPLFPPLSKDIASFTKDTAPSDPLTLVISNGYPGYAVDCKLDFTNVGSIPVHVEREYFDFDLDNDGQFDDLHVECTTSSGGQPNCRNVDPVAHPWNDTTDSSPIFVQWVDGLGCQIHPGYGNSGDLLIGIRQPAHESSTYRVKMSVQVNQYNESIWNGCANPKAPVPSIPTPPAGLLSNP